MKTKKCKQCANPQLKGVHTCEHRTVLLAKHAEPTLVERLRKTCQRADQSGDRDDYRWTNHAGWMLAVKLDAIGEALALLVEVK